MSTKEKTQALPIQDMPSPNFNERRGVDAPSFLIMHYTGMKTAQEALDRLCSAEAEVSAHYLIDEDGRIVSMVDEKMRAWHAGKSHWAGQTDMNSLAIGIEIVNPGHEWGYRPFPVAQMQALVLLCRDIMRRWPIVPENVLGHSDIAPVRRWYDPGELFDWRMLAGHGIGVWPQPDEDDRREALPLTMDEGRLRAALTAYGYDPEIPLADVVKAFQRHFHPEIFRRPDEAGIADAETAARLCALLRQKQRAA